MLRRSLNTLATVVILFSALSSFAQLHIDVDTTWDSDQILTQSVIVDAGVTLTIEAGVNITPIYIDIDDNNVGDISFTVLGILNLQGEVCNRVTFTPFEETSDLHYWEGLIINSASANPNLTNFTLDHAHLGLNIQTDAEVHNGFISDCPHGILVENGALVTVEDSWIHDVPGSGIVNAASTTTVNNTHLTNNGRFGLVNHAGTLVMGFCTIDFNDWGGLYLGGSSTNDIQNSTITSNLGSAFEISEWTFADDFSSVGVKQAAPSVLVNTCNIYGNADSSFDVTLDQDEAFLNIPDWGACQDLLDANDSESLIWELPIGYVASQTVTCAKYCAGGSSSSWDRTYYLRNAYTDVDLDVTVQSTISPCNCGYANNLGNRYHAGPQSFDVSSTPNDQYYWYLAPNSTSSHGIWDAVTTVRIGGYEVYSSVADAATFDFTGNYWGTILGVDDLVFDVNNPNTDYAAFVVEEFPFAYADVDDGLPNIDLGGDTNICEGTGILLDAGNGGSEYLWTPGDFDSQTLQIDEAGTYSVMVSNDCGSNTAAITILAVDPLPLVPAAPVGQTLLCPNSANTTYTSSDADFASSYQWQVTPAEAGTISGSGTSGIVDWAEAYIGTAEVSVYAVNACGTSSYSEVIEVDVINAPSQPSTPTGVTSFCVAPSSSAYTTLGSALAENYTWTIEPAGAGSISGTGTTGTVLWTPEYEGTAQISVSGEGYCGQGGISSPIAVTVGIYEANIEGLEGICTGETIQLTANEADTYTWSTGGDTQSIEVVVEEDMTVELTINDDEGCEANTSIDLQAFELPVITFSGDLEICESEEAQVTASGAELYTWDDGEWEATVTVSPEETTTYGLYATNAAGCGIEAEVTITVQENPSVSIAGNDEVCDGGNTTLVATGAETYAWENGPDTNEWDVNPGMNTTYVVTGYSSAGCSGTAQIEVTIVDSPDAAIDGPTLLCLGDNGVLTASGGGDYEWGSGADSEFINVAPEETTTYWVDVTNAQGCTSVAQWTVEVSSLNDLSISGEEAICLGESVTLIASGAGDYEWNTGDLGSILNATPDQTIGYTVSATNDDGCSGELNWVVTVHAQPDVPTIVEFGEELLSSSLSGNQWYYEGVPLPAETNQAITPTQNGNYTVIVTDENGCTSESEPLLYAGIGIEELEGTSFTISPNPSNGAITLSFEHSKTIAFVSVYNELGQEVYRKDSPQVSGGALQLDLTHLAAGVYLLTVGVEGGVRSERFVVGG